jgi:molybdopterin/thiamine biosynthesis adenylyltransferase
VSPDDSLSDGLSDGQLERYARHIVLRQIGGEGQRMLLAGHAVVIGAGGIGSPLIQYLAAAGVGQITIVDDDLVSLSNLQRQILYGTADQGAGKAERAKAAAERLNPDVKVTAQAVRLTPDNAAQLLAGAQVVVDGSDSFATRLAVSDSALALRIPLVSASVAQFEGQLGLFRGWEADKPCYRCLVGSDPDRPEQSCSEQGVLGAMAGVMGSLAAVETIRVLTGFGEDSAGKLLLVDSLALRFRTVALRKDPGCPACRV